MPKRRAELIKSDMFHLRVQPQNLRRWEEAAKRNGVPLSEYVTWVVNRNADLMLGPNWREPSGSPSLDDFMDAVKTEIDRRRRASKPKQ